MKGFALFIVVMCALVFGANAQSVLLSDTLKARFVRLTVEDYFS